MNAHPQLKENRLVPAEETTAPPKRSTRLHPDKAHGTAPDVSSKLYQMRRRIRAYIAETGIRSRFSLSRRTRLIQRFYALL